MQSQRLFRFVFGLYGLSMTCILILFVYARFPYTPSDITELQNVPKLLQGDTDWSGSNIFAAYVTCLFVAGVFTSVYLTVSLAGNGRSFARCYGQSFFILRIHFIMFLAITALFGWPVTYFHCEKLGVSVVAVSAYLTTQAVVAFVATTKFGLLARVVIGLIPIGVWLVLSMDGTTFKSGQARVSGELPHPTANSLSHYLVTFPQRFCPTVGEEEFLQ